MAPKSSGGGGSENIESVIHDGIISMGLIAVPFSTKTLLVNGVDGILGTGVGVGVDAFDSMLSIEFLLELVRRLSVPLPLLSSLRFRLWRRVKVPPRSGDAGLVSENLVVSPTSFSLPVIDVNGKFGFIVGFRLIVPVVNSESNALLSSDRQPLLLELDALDRRPFEFEGTFVLQLLLPLLPVLHCDGTAEAMLPIEPLLAEESLSSSSRAKSSNKVLWLSNNFLPY